MEAEQVVYNELEPHMVELLKYINDTPTDMAIKEIDNIINKYGLSKTNADGFAQLRNDYNNDNNSAIMFYALICHSFNNQFRFNGNGKFNMPFGKNKSCFNDRLRNKYMLFSDRLHSINCKFVNSSFEDFDFDSMTDSDFVYADPPYLNSDASYNENGGWDAEKEKKLLDVLDNLNEKGIKFALSNNLKYDNGLLEDWRQKYTTNYLGGNYKNCNYHKKDKTDGEEILVTNY